MTPAFDPVSGKQRLLQLVRERAYRDGLDITLASGKKSTFYIHGKKVSLHPEGLWLIARLMLDALARHPEVTAIGGLTWVSPTTTATSNPDAPVLTPTLHAMPYMNWSNTQT